MKTSVTRIFEFAYAHKLPSYQGKCENMHGHNAVLEVEVDGCNLDGYPTMVTDFGILKTHVTDHILKYLDHRDLTDFFTVPATAETMAMWIFQQLNELPIYEGHVKRIRVYETSTSYAEVTRD